MNFHSPAHRTVPWDAGSRLNGRLRGESHSRASGRDPGLSPPRIPAARVCEVKTVKG